jgi:arsenite-transporting ATPase
VLFTGKGGVGKTTVASATALRAADAGLRTLVLSTDPAHSLADALDVPLGDTPAPVADRLWGQQLDARVRFEETWDDVRGFVVDLLRWAGAGEIEAAELSVVPGLDEVFALADIKAFATSDEYDLVVVDCAPTAETIRLLSLPDVLGWYMDRFFNVSRRLTSMVRPALTRLTTMPVASDEVFAAVRRFYDRLDGVRELLTDADVTSARIVVNPERMVIAEARRTFTYLSMFGYSVDAVIANRLLPESIEDPWFAQWRDAQTEHLGTIRESFAPVPVLTADLAAHELRGVEDLQKLGTALYGVTSPAARLSHHEPLRVEHRDGIAVLSLHLPYVQRDDVEVSAGGGDLYVAIGPHRRAVALPDSLRRLSVTSARMHDDRLEVQFA